MKLVTYNIHRGTGIKNNNTLENMILFLKNDYRGIIWKINIQEQNY